MSEGQKIIAATRKRHAQLWATNWMFLNLSMLVAFGPLPPRG